MVFHAYFNHIASLPARCQFVEKIDSQSMTKGLTLTQWPETTVKCISDVMFIIKYVKVRQLSLNKVLLIRNLKETWHRCLVCFLR